MDDGSVAESLVMALGAALIRSGALDPDQLTDAADRADDGTERGGTVAHLLNCMVIHGSAPSAQEVAADRRVSLRLVKGDSE